MQEPTDDQLDGLFRKSAEEFNPPFDPAAWQALKSRLDTHDRLTIWEHLLRWGLPVLLLLMLTGGSWNAHRQQAMANQTPDLGAVAQQPASANAELVTNRPAQSGRKQRGNKARSLPNETVAVTKRDGPTETAIVQPNDSKPTVLRDEAVRTGRIETGGDAGQRVALATNSKRSPPVPDKLTDRAIRPARSATSGGPTDRTGPARLPMAPAPVLTVARTERLRFVKTGRKRSRRLSGGRTEKRTVGTFPATNYAIEPARSFTKRQGKSIRQVTPDAADSNSINELRSDVGSQPAADAISAHRFSVGTSDRISSLLVANDAEPVVLYSFIELTNRPGQWPEPLSFTGREVTAPVTSVEMKQPVSTQPVVLQKGLSVRFVVSPDLSAIGLRNFQRPGTNVGLLLEYRLASRWSVQAGVMRGTKVYKALPADYKWPAGWNWRLIPESISGRCTVIDIPINVRYDVALRPRPNGQAPGRWFVSGGVTSYVMQQEKYVYNYPVGAHTYPTTPKERNERTGLYGFSQLNLSAGYERALSRRLSYQVEPFAKVPLKGVGFFKINLLSTGAFFSLRYKL